MSPLLGLRSGSLKWRATKPGLKAISMLYLLLKQNWSDLKGLYKAVFNESLRGFKAVFNYINSREHYKSLALPCITSLSLKYFILCLLMGNPCTNFKCQYCMYDFLCKWGLGTLSKLRSRSRSSPGPFLVHSRSIWSHSNLFQFKIRWSGPGADAIFTVPPTHQ